ncbi:MAG: transglutaminase domain-containing protein [Candidatus Aminicenantes bacterium]|nr:MAG: transglutaminase domain-containing protein [Candidatus Aminicenantes bacterium]
MNKNNFKSWLSFGFCILLVGFFLLGENRTEIYYPEKEESGKIKEEVTQESWMGIYMNELKVGYSHELEISLLKGGMKYKKSYSESWMKVSRLGGNPVEIMTKQESLYDEDDRPLETLLRTKMSEIEMVIKAEIHPERILFKSNGKLIKELPYKEKFYLGVPIEKIINEEGLKSGKKYKFKILEPLTHSFVDCSFEVIGREDVLILGNKMNLWHVKTEAAHLVPVTMEDWIDDSGISWKNISKASLINTTSIRMSKEKAQEVSDENFDIAFSTIIESNVIFENPQEIQKVTFKLSGISIDKIKKFPFDDGSQEILETGKDYALVQTSSLIFKEAEAISFPVEDEKLRKYLKPTSFCQSDDSEIKETADLIVGKERNSWRAAKKIAEWIRRELTPNYDVGFASAKEILKNREGDCSEHTVLTVTLCRAAGIPARAAVGVMYAHGIFAYHMWPEVYVGRWIGLDAKWLAIDRKSGEHYTDATHLKFGRSALDENIFKEMAQAVSEIIGLLKLEIVDFYREINKKI